MSGFLANYRRHHDVHSDAQAQDILQTYLPQQLPVLSTLAKSYAVSDRWFSSVPSQTYCNRGFVGAGTSCGQTDNDLLRPFDAQTIWNVLVAGDEALAVQLHHRATRTDARLACDAAQRRRKAYRVLRIVLWWQDGNARAAAG